MMHKIVNGKRIELTAQEEQAIQAEWDSWIPPKAPLALSSRIAEVEKLSQEDKDKLLTAVLAEYLTDKSHLAVAVDVALDLNTK